MRQATPSPAMIVCNGRVESYLKYRELAIDFFELGYSVYLLDHRGQGLSERMTQDHHQGHVVDFNDYIEDLAKFIADIIVPNQHTQHILLGHSMGGAIAARYIETCPHVIDKLILASPMFGIVLPLPVALVQLLTRVMQYYGERISSEPTYVIGGQPYVANPFDKNGLTHSRERYQEFQDLYQLHPEIQLGAPTNQWLAQAMDAALLCIEQAHMITIPTLLLQAASDTIVKNSEQDAFAAQMATDLIKLVKVDDARHELFFEQDCYRQQALSAILNFLN